DLLPPARAGQLEPPTTVPAGDHGLREQLDTGLGSELSVALGVTGPAEHRPQVAEPEAGVVRVARDAAGLALALDHGHRLPPEPRRLDRRGGSGRATADDHRALHLRRLLVFDSGAGLAGEQVHQLGGAEEALTAPHQRPGAAPQTVEIRGRDRAG